MRTDPACATQPERILLLTSLQSENSMLVSFASTLAELHHSHLTLLHVLDSAGMTEQERELARFNARQKLAGLIPREARHRHQPVLLISEGDATKVILDVAGLTSQDLIILGGAYPSFFSWLLGTNLVYRVIVEAMCPVITIKLSAGSATEKPSRRDAIDAGESLVHSIECNEETVTSR
jgi:nucleotide-binding universal stress UspA family protein